MSVVMYNTAHELISKVNKLELYKVLNNRYGRGIHGTCLEPRHFKKNFIDYDNSNIIIF